MLPVAGRRPTSPAPASTTHSPPTAAPALRSRAAQPPPIRFYSAPCRDSPVRSRSRVQVRRLTASAPSIRRRRASVEPTRSRPPCRPARLRQAVSPGRAFHSTHATPRRSLPSSRFLSRGSYGRGGSPGCFCSLSHSAHLRASPAVALRGSSQAPATAALLRPHPPEPTTSPSVLPRLASPTAFTSRSSCNDAAHATRPALTALAHAH